MWPSLSKQSRGIKAQTWGSGTLPPSWAKFFSLETGSTGSGIGKWSFLLNQWDKKAL